MTEQVVRVALRHHGRVTQRDFAPEEARLLLLQPRFFVQPDIQGRVDAGPFAPKDDGLIVIDADTQWIGELRHACNLTVFDASDVVRSMTMALRVAQTRDTLSWNVEHLKNPEGLAPGVERQPFR